MPLDIVTRDEVLGRFGGAAYVSQIADKDNDGVYDGDIVDRARWDAAEEVAARCNVQVLVQAIAQAVAAGQVRWTDYWLLQSYVGRLAVCRLWTPGTQGQAKPQNIKDEEAQIFDDCDKVRRGEMSLGVPPSPPGYPALQHTVQLVDNDPRNERMTLSGFRGLLV